MKKITRFIPTYVGLTFLLIVSQSYFAVHPHVCGAYGFHPAAKYLANGSSPRMWGLRRMCGPRYT